MPTVIEYQFDPTGELVANRIVNEYKTSNPSVVHNFPFLVPDAAPFFAESFQIWRTDTNAPLEEGVDFFFTHKFEQASTNTLKEVYGSVSFFLNGYQGEVRMTYQTIGGEWVLRTTEEVESLFNSLLNPRTSYWEQVFDLPYAFPAIDHGHSAEDTSTYADMIEAVNSLALAVEAQAEQNSEYATMQEALDGVRTDRIMSPATTAAKINQAITNTISGVLDSQYAIGYGHNQKLAQVLFGEPLFLTSQTENAFNLSHNGTNFVASLGQCFLSGMLLELNANQTLTNPPAYPRDLWLVGIVPNGATAGRHSPTFELVWNVADAALVYNPNGRTFVSTKIARVNSTVSWNDLRRTQRKGFGLAFTHANPSVALFNPNSVIPKLTQVLLKGQGTALEPTEFRLPDVVSATSPVYDGDWVEVERSGHVRINSYNGTFDKIRLERTDGSFEIGEGIDFNINTKLRFRWNSLDGYWEV